MAEYKEGLNRSHSRLSAIAQYTIDKNPHIKQLDNPKYHQFINPLPYVLTSAPLTIAGTPRMEYQRRLLSERSTNHWGQLKLFVMELYFLTRFTCGPNRSNKEWTVVYAGAAPGQHTPHLTKLFPNCTFILYDPAPYCPDLAWEAHERITVINRFFIEETADEYKDCNDVLFISDIRTRQVPTSVISKNEEDEIDSDVRANMARQAGWVKTIKPVAAMLKFRLPWTAGTTAYFPGEVWIQAWAPTTSTETRLVCTRDQILETPIHYDNTEYEEQMMYHNTIRRCQLFDHGLSLGAVPGLDLCYDCSITVLAFHKYLAATSASEDNISETDITNALTNTLKAISPVGRTLDCIYPVSTSLKAAVYGKFAFYNYTDDKFTITNNRSDTERRKSQ